MDTIRRKFIEALKATNTSEIIEQMDRDGELEKIFPHILEMKKIGKCRFHVVDSFTHSMNALKELEKVINKKFFPNHLVEFVRDDIYTQVDDEFKKVELLKLATFLHDMGKPRSMTVGEDGNAHFKGHEKIGADMLHDVIAEFKISEKAEEIVHKYIEYHMMLLEFYKNDNMGKKVLYKAFRKVGPDIAGVMIIGYSDVVCTRRLIYENENYGVLRTYIDYALTSYYYRFDEEISTENQIY